MYSICVEELQVHPNLLISQFNVFKIDRKTLKILSIEKDKERNIFSCNRKLILIIK